MLDVSRSIAVAVIEAGGVAVDDVTSTIGRIRLTEGQVVTADHWRSRSDRPPRPIQR